MKENKCVKVSFEKNAVCINSSFFRGQIKDRETYSKVFQEISQLKPEERTILNCGLRKRPEGELSPIGFPEHVIFSILKGVEKLG